METKHKTSFKQWWHTDCKLCKKTRLIAFWLLIMFVTDALWFHLIIK